jgi:hypothetical protein
LARRAAHRPDNNLILLTKHVSHKIKEMNCQWPQWAVACYQHYLQCIFGEWQAAHRPFLPLGVSIHWLHLEYSQGPSQDIFLSHITIFQPRPAMTLRIAAWGKVDVREIWSCKRRSTRKKDSWRWNLNRFIASLSTLQELLSLLFF